MSQKNVFNLWRETLSSKPISRNISKDMHLAVLPRATHQKLGDELSIIQFEIQDLVVCELKGSLQSVVSFDLPTADGETLWLCLQFQGKTTFSNAKTSATDTQFSFVTDHEQRTLTLAAEKQWALFLGLSAASKQQLLSELPMLRKQYDQSESKILKATPLSEFEHQTLESLSKTTFGSFSTVHHIGQLMIIVFTNYTQQLLRHTERTHEEFQVLLYHRAIAYIRANFMDRPLNREKIAEDLHCSIRSLTRAFEGRSTSLYTTILSFRLHKGRELLRSRPKLTVEQIAIMLYFPDAKHFAVQYKKYFHRTPREERKEIKIRK